MVSKHVKIHISGPMPDSVTITFENIKAKELSVRESKVTNRRWPTFPSFLGHSEEVRKQCVNLMNQGLSSRDVARQTGVGKTSVLRWYGKDCQLSNSESQQATQLEAKEVKTTTLGSHIDGSAKTKNGRKRLISGRFKVLIDAD